MIRTSYFLAFWFVMVTISLFNEFMTVTPMVVIGFGMISSLSVGVQFLVETIVRKLK